MLGKRVRLRAVSPDDAETLHALWSDVDTYLLAADSPFVPRSLASFRARLEHETTEGKDPTADVRLIAESVPDGTALGTGGLWGITLYDQLAHLSIALLPSARGQGYGTEVVALLVEYGFRMRNLRRLELETLATNVAMRRAAEANGFVLEGIQRERGYQGDGFDDMALYGLLRREWTPGTGSVPA